MNKYKRQGWHRGPTTDNFEVISKWRKLALFPDDKTLAASSGLRAETVSRLKRRRPGKKIRYRGNRSYQIIIARLTEAFMIGWNGHSAIPNEEVLKLYLAEWAGDFDSGWVEREAIHQVRSKGYIWPLPREATIIDTQPETVRLQIVSNTSGQIIQCEVRTHDLMELLEKFQPSMVPA